MDCLFISWGLQERQILKKCSNFGKIRELIQLKYQIELDSILSSGSDVTFSRKSEKKLIYIL